MVARIHRALVHLRRGTLLERLRTERRRYRNKWRRFIRATRGFCWKLRVRRKFAIEAVVPSAGLRLKLYKDSKLCRMIYCGGFEVNELSFVGRYLREGDVFIDVGANIGLYTVMAAQNVGPKGTVYAFEPSTKSFKRLLGNIQLNGLMNVRPYQLALSNTKTQLKLTVPSDGHDAWSSLACPSLGEAFVDELVDTTTLDGFAEENELVGRIALAKIDVEGWESFVLEGARMTLSRPDAPVLIIELNDTASRVAGSSAKEVYQLLGSLGYTMFRYDGESHSILRYTEPDDPVDHNVIASKDMKAMVTRIGLARPQSFESGMIK